MSERKPSITACSPAADEDCLPVPAFLSSSAFDDENRMLAEDIVRAVAVGARSVTNAMSLLNWAEANISSRIDRFEEAGADTADLETAYSQWSRVYASLMDVLGHFWSLQRCFEEKCEERQQFGVSRTNGGAEDDGQPS